MPRSTKYSGNPFISRRERLDSITLYNRLPDEQLKKAVYISRVLENVRVEIVNANNFSTAGSQKDYSCQLTIELRDGNRYYQHFSEWNGENPQKWTINPGKDYFVYNTSKYMITSLEEKKNVNGSVDILKVYAK